MYFKHVFPKNTQLNELLYFVSPKINSAKSPLNIESAKINSALIYSALINYGSYWKISSDQPLIFCTRKARNVSIK